MFDLLVGGSLALGLMAGAYGQEAWVDRLKIADLYELDLDLTVDSSAMGISTGFDLGFEKDSEELLANARQRMEDGEVSARVQHEILRGLIRTNALGNEDLKLLESCLNSYDAELREAPEDVDKRMGFANALSLAFRVLGAETFFEDASTEISRAAEISPNDWRIHAELATMCLRRYSVGEENGEPEPQWLEKCIEAAEAGLSASPKALGAHWCLFHMRTMAALAVEEGDAKFEKFGKWSDVLAKGAAECEGGDLLALCGQASWFVVYIPSLFQDEAKGEAEPSDDERERLTSFFANLEAAPEHPILARIAPAGWIVHALTHPVAEDAARMDVVVGAGMDRESARAMAFALHRHRGHVTGVAELAEALAGDAERDETRCALVHYYCHEDEDKRALEQLQSLTEWNPARTTAHGVLLLRTGEHARALEVLETITAPSEKWPGLTEHALGVALALNDRLEDAAAKLEEAVALLSEPDDARKTLAEVREKMRMP